MSEPIKIRIDKWLWSVRLYKTRSLASEACTSGRIKIDGDAVKASYMLKVGQTIHLHKQGEKSIVKVTKLIEKRVGAPVAMECYEDLTPPEEKDKLKFPSIFTKLEIKELGDLLKRIDVKLINSKIYNVRIN